MDCLIIGDLTVFFFHYFNNIMATSEPFHDLELPLSVLCTIFYQNQPPISHKIIAETMVRDDMNESCSNDFHQSSERNGPTGGRTCDSLFSSRVRYRLGYWSSITTNSCSESGHKCERK